MIPVRDAAVWARELGISEHALALYRDSEVIDLHLDSFIWHRLLGYRIGERHARPPLAGWHLGHADFHRAREAGLSAATWVITTNPLRDPLDRFETLLENIRELSAQVGAFGDDLMLARTYSDYRAARARGSHAVFLGVQGGNALIEPPDSIERVPALALLRVTLMHLTNSRIGATSSPLRFLTTPGLTPFGRDFVARLNAANVLVDLAHIDRQGFWDALDVQAPHVPAIVTHTGVAGARAHWRNLDDAQLRAIAETGGVVGILFHSSFIASNWFTARAEHVVEHLAHVVRVAGEDTPALGSDFDGNIIPPRDLLSVLDLPRLVELMLRRGFSEVTIRKILGQNFLRVLAQTRP